MAWNPIDIGPMPNAPPGQKGTPWRECWNRVNQYNAETQALQSRIISAADKRFENEPTTEAKIQAAINQAVLELATAVFVPAFMLPYNASLVTFNTAIRMVREGGNFSHYDVVAYGASGDGVTSASPSFTAALAAAGVAEGTCHVPDPAVGYLLTDLHLIPTNTTMKGENKHGTRLIHGRNGYMLDLNGGATLERLFIDGNGASFTGRGIFMAAGQGKQTIISCKIINFADYCIDFAHEEAGSQFMAVDVELGQLVGTSPGQEAVIVRGSLPATAQRRTWIGVQTENRRFCNFGPASGFFVVGGAIGDCIWSNDTRGVNLTGLRYAGGDVSATILGAETRITGCHVYPQLTIGAASVKNNIKGNSYDNPGIIDLANDASNVLEDQKPLATFVQFSANDATPDVSQSRGGLFQCNNSSPTTITYFDGGINGQEITVRIDANTAITHNNSLIRLASDTSIPLSAYGPNSLITFRRISGIWFEQMRSFEITPAVRTLTDAATIAVDVAAGGTFVVTLGGNRTMGQPASVRPGYRIHFTIIQDGTGGRTLAWHAVYKVSWSDTGNTSGKRSTIAFIFDGTNWNQDGAQTPYV